MARYEILEHELGRRTEVVAPGIAEAMFELLPWPTLDISVHWSPSSGVITVTDRQTDFKYDLELL